MRLINVALVWLAMLAVDLVLHAGLLSGFYVAGGAFLLEPMDAFIRIPAGYAAFLILAAAIVWLLERLEATGIRDGARVGLLAGAVVWGALVLGLWSISTAEPGLLVAWWIGQSVELGVGGAVAGALLAGARPRRVGAWVIAMLVAALLIVVVLQSTGLVPTVRINS